MARARVVKTPKITVVQVNRIIDTSPGAQALARKNCEQLIVEAKSIFERLRKAGPWRPSETSPPRYAESFGIQRVNPRKWKVYNDDPGWNLVEYPVHPGGGVTVAGGYAPMRKAIDILGSLQ